MKHKNALFSFINVMNHFSKAVEQLGEGEGEGVQTNFLGLQHPYVTPVTKLLYKWSTKC